MTLRFLPSSATSRLTLFAPFLVFFGAAAARPPQPQASAGSANSSALDSTRTKEVVLRDRFIAGVRAAGFSCPLSAPTIVVEDVPSFGQYDPETNTLRTSDWTVLRPAEREMFVHLAGPGKPEGAARDLFETAAHQWIFIHELGHWWQACTGGNGRRSPYQVEYGANRISLAYWRQADPAVATTMGPVFEAVFDHTPSPVPAGRSVEDYFNSNYEKLGPSPAYPWFMSKMNVAAFEERPAPRFAAALAAEKQ